MTISQRIQIGDYIFIVYIQSASTHAHSLMTDNKKEIEEILTRFTNELQYQRPLPALVEIHKERKG